MLTDENFPEDTSAPEAEPTEVIRVLHGPTVHLEGMLTKGVYRPRGYEARLTPFERHQQRATARALEAAAAKK